MATLYDENGEIVEGALTAEEALVLQQKTTELEERASKAAELEETLKQKEEELTKLAGKDLNFKRLRDKSEAEIEELKTKMSEKEKILLTEVMELTQERDGEKRARFEEVKADVLRSLTGGDEAMMKSVEAAEKELVGEAKTAKELEERYRKAYILARGVAPSKNPLYSGYSSSYSEPDVSKKSFADTDEGKASINQWFPNIAKKILPEDK